MEISAQEPAPQDNPLDIFGAGDVVPSQNELFCTKDSQPASSSNANASPEPPPDASMDTAAARSDFQPQLATPSAFKPLDNGGISLDASLPCPDFQPHLANPSAYKAVDSDEELLDASPPRVDFQPEIADSSACEAVRDSEPENDSAGPRRKRRSRRRRRRSSGDEDEVAESDASWSGSGKSDLSHKSDDEGFEESVEKRPKPPSPPPRPEVMANRSSGESAFMCEKCDVGFVKEGRFFVLGHLRCWGPWWCMSHASLMKGYWDRSDKKCFFSPLYANLRRCFNRAQQASYWRKALCLPTGRMREELPMED